MLPQKVTPGPFRLVNTSACTLATQLVGVHEPSATLLLP